MDELLQTLVLICLIAGGVLHLFHRLRLPAIVGLLLAGVLIGPHGLGLVTERAQIDRLAEIGILLLMFSVGLDFTRDRIRELIRASGMGLVQMLICIVGTVLVVAMFVNRWAEAVFLGFLIAHTSSTLMLKLFMDRGELHSPQVRLGLGISITQDLSVVPMLLAVPMLAAGQWQAAHFGQALLRATAVLLVALALARWVIPAWIHLVMSSRSRELFLIFLMVVCLGTAWATTAAGLSMALGAFLAGMAIAGSPYSHQTTAEVVPFRDLLISLFFISIGMLLDLRAVAGHAGIAVLIVLGIIALKFASGWLPALLWGYPLRIAALVGVALAQVGEFSFVLAHTGYELQLITEQHFQLFVLAAIATMLVNPFLVGAGPAMGRQLARLWGQAPRAATPQDESEQAEPPLADHVLIAGYGLNGRNLVRGFQLLEMPYVVLDLNPAAVQEARERGENAFFGDCTRADVLRRMHIRSARVLVVAISDPPATRQAVQVARHENPGLTIIVRSKYLSEIDSLQQLGADAVIAEEFETSLEILALALKTYDLAQLNIDRIVQHLRSDAYRAFRRPPSPGKDRRLLDEIFPALEIESADVPADSPGVGRNLRELDLHARTGATVLAARRDGQWEVGPSAEFRLQANDLLVLAGTPDHLSRAADVLKLRIHAPPH